MSIASRFGAVAAFLALSCLVCEAQSDTVDDFVRAEMAGEKVPGLAVAIIERGEVTKATGYGLANVELGVPVGPETVFQSGSLGKQFTAGSPTSAPDSSPTGRLRTRNCSRVWGAHSASNSWSDANWAMIATTGTT